MSKRWTIRGLFLSLLALCAGGWAWSGAYTERLTYTASGRDWSVELAPGKLVFWSGAPSTTPGWHYVHGHPDWEIGELYTGLGGWHLLGFHFFVGSHPYSPGVTAVLLVVPCWFLSALAGAASIVAWWKTRARPDGPGFPVETTSEGHYSPSEKCLP